MTVLTDKWMAEQMLFQYLLNQAIKKFDERKELIVQIKTKEDVEKRQDYVRRKHAEMFREFPPKTPLHPQIVGELDREDYIVEKIIFESRPEFYVPANLYLPKNREFPVPAILSPCGHSPNGKAYETYQHLSIALVKKGYLEEENYSLEKLTYTSEPGIVVPALAFIPKTEAPFPAILYVHEAGKSADLGAIEELVNDGVLVLAIDPRGMGETRAKYLDSLCHGAFMLGRTVFGMQLLDVIKAIDYLQARSDVDKLQLSCVGCGIGGLLAMHAAAIDERITSVISNGALITYKSLIVDAVYSHGVEVFIPHVLKDYDLPDIAALIAPRPLKLLGLIDHKKETVEPEVVAQEYNWTTEVYELFNNAEKFSIL